MHRWMERWKDGWKKQHIEVGAPPNKRRSKFDPYFLPVKFCVIDISANGNILLIENTTTGLGLKPHPNDIKLFKSSLPM